MHILRMIARVLSTAIFRFCVFVFPLLAAFAIMFHSPTLLQNTMRDSGIYGNVVDAVLKESANEAAQDNNNEAQNLLGDEGVRKVAQESIKPETLDSAFVATTNGIYGWLQGKTDQPEFKIDLTDTKDALVNNLSAYAEERASKLPICTAQQLQQLSTQPQPDILSIPCLPPGTSAKQLSQEFSNDATDDLGFLKDPVLTQDTLRNDKTQKGIADDFHTGPDLYQATVLMPWIIGALMVVSALAMIFLHNKRRRGIQSVGMTLLATGLLLLVFTAIYFILFDDIGKWFVQSELAAGMRTSIANFVDSLFATYAKITGVIAAIYVLVGFAMVVIELKTREKPVVTPPQTPETPHSTELPKVKSVKKEKARP